MDATSAQHEYWLDKLPAMDQKEFEDEVAPLLSAMSEVCQMQHDSHDNSCFAKMEDVAKRTTQTFEAWRLSSIAFAADTWHEQIQQADKDWTGAVTTDAATVGELRRSAF